MEANPEVLGLLGTNLQLRGTGQRPLTARADPPIRGRHGDSSQGHCRQ
jgi:hypothetical protein